MAGKHKTRPLSWVAMRIRRGRIGSDHDIDKWTAISIGIEEGKIKNVRIDLSAYNGIRNIKWQWFIV